MAITEVFACADEEEEEEDDVHEEEDQDVDVATSRFELEEVKQNDPDDLSCLPPDAIDMERIQEAELEETKAKAAALAAQAEQQMAELSGLLTKTKTINATREEMNQVETLMAQLHLVKKDIEECKARESIQELAVFKSASRRVKFDLLRAIKEREIQDVIQTVNAAERVDLAFVIDATGTMRSCIDNVKNSLTEIVSRIKNTNTTLNLRLAVVAYRDFCYRKRFQVLDFVTAIDEFETFLHALKAGGSYTGKVSLGDLPEDMAGGIEKANSLSWSNPTRIVFVIADAPCHGREFHNFDPDYFPTGTPGIDIKEQLRTLMANHSDAGSMTVYFGRITSHTDQMIARLEQCGISLKVVAFDDPDKIESAVTQGVRSSIFKTISMSASGFNNAISFYPVDVNSDSASTVRNKSSAKLKPYKVKPALPRFEEWENRPSVFVKVYRSRPIKSIEDLKAPLVFGFIKIRRWKRTDKTDKSTMVLRCAIAPFAEGETRISFHGRLAPLEEELNLDKNALVLKSFKYLGEGANDLRHYLKQMEVANVAYFLSRLYNRSYRPENCGRVNFLQVCVVEDTDESKEAEGSRRFCAEMPLPTDGSAFTQYSNNTGYWNEDTLDQTLLRFTEFTYEATKGYLMVTDLQGVRKGGDYFLTDPVVLCQDVCRFGHTNLGGKFMQKCINATWAIMNEKGW